MTLFDVCGSLVAQINSENELLLSVFQNETSSMNHEEVYLLMNEFQNLPLEHVFSPEFTGQRAQIILHGHPHHLEYSDCHYQTFVACVPLSTKHFSVH